MLLGVTLKAAFVLVMVVGVLVPLVAWAERKQGALMQDRAGAGRTGWTIFSPASCLDTHETSRGEGSARDERYSTEGIQLLHFFVSSQTGGV